MPIFIFFILSGLLFQKKKNLLYRNTWFGFGISGQLSHASPTPSPSRSSWSRFFTRWQLSRMFLIPYNNYGLTQKQKDKTWTDLLLLCTWSLTVSIHVIVTCVSEAIWICVSLIWVIHSDTVVACVAVTVFITVQLIYIRGQPAVVLKFVHRHTTI